MFANTLTERMAAFVRGIGIDVRAERLPADTFPPGLDIHYGSIVVDEEQLYHPSDLLHEAGHVAVTDPDERGTATLDPSSAEELASLAWSYAALRHLELAPDIVFHPHGCGGGAQALINCFTKAAGRGVVLGVPLLACFGMTVEAKCAAARGVEPYPHMLRWLR